MKREVRHIEKEVARSNEHRKPLSTLLNEAKGREVKVLMIDGEMLRGKLEKFSLYEIQVDNKIIWKQAIKYLEIVK